MGPIRATLLALAAVGAALICTEAVASPARSGTVAMSGHPAARVSDLVTTNRGARVQVDCVTGPCPLRFLATTVEHLSRGGSVMYLSATGRGRTVVIAGGSFLIRSRVSSRIKIYLNHAGAALLARFCTLPTSVSVMLTSGAQDRLIFRRSAQIKAILCKRRSRQAR